jgi:hypothetical protein
VIYTEASARRLALLRLGVLLVCALDVARDPFPELAALPRSAFTGHGPWALAPSGLLEAVWNETALLSLKLATVVAIALAMLGVRHARRWAGLAALLLILTWGFVRGFGHADHSQLQLLFITFALPFLPAWDALALAREEPAQRAHGAYAGAFVALAAVFGFPYFLTGASRLAQAGYAIFMGDALQHFIARDTLTLDDFDSTLGLSLLAPALRPLLNLSFFGVTLVELSAPWAYLERRAAMLWLLLVLPFHLLTPLLMHVSFEHNVALIGLLYLWPLSWRRGPAQAPIELARVPADQTR